jgi:tetratricopeptide (TPR) repeat protein
VSTIEGRVDVTQLSPDDQQRIQRAKATVANLHGQYQEALDLLRDVDEDVERVKTETRKEQEFQLIQTKADSLYGLHRWQDALKSFSRLVQLKPTDVGARSGKARCLYYLGSLQPSKEIWDGLISELTAAYKHGRIGEGSSIAAAFANRAGIVADLGDLGGAVVDLTAAIDMCKKVAKEKPQPVPAALVRTLVRRGGIQADLGHFAAALDDLRDAHAICEERKATGQLAEANELSSVVRHNKATVLFDCGKENEALEEVSKAIELQEHIVRNPAYAFLSDELAGSCVTRGTILMARGREAEAITDFTRAIDIFQPLVAQQQRVDLGLLLATALRSRGSLFARQAKFKQAEEDVDAAEKLLRGLIKKGNRLDLTAEMAIVWTTSGQLVLGVARRTKDSKKLLEKAEDIYSESIKLFVSLYDRSPKVQYKQGHAAALSSRSTVRHRLGRREESRKDLEDAYALFLELDKATNSADMRLQLSECLIGLGVSVAEAGELNKGIDKVGAAIDMQRRLVKKGNATALVVLASALQIRGRLYAKTGNKENALKDLDESIAVCRSSMDRDGRTGLEGLLSRSTRYRGLVAEGKAIPDER